MELMPIFDAVLLAVFDAVLLAVFAGGYSSL